ncbi:MAG: hypothetical protein CL878_00335 [Dehalococcoidia bacterium]|nr:hypothetical protein [Dehalococcoidia bacterium]
MPEPHVYIVEDDPHIRFVVRLACEAAYRVSEAGTAEAALALVPTDPPDLVLLDLVMPGLGGQAFIPAFRELSEAPIIVLSALGSEADKVAALQAGADDYLTKPFGIDELLARLARNLARWERFQHSSHPPRSPVFRTADDHLEVDLHGRTVMVQQRAVRLTPLEFTLLACLAQQADRVVPPETLLRAGWDTDDPAEGVLLRVAIHRLRQKVEPQPGQPRYLVTEAGLGYRLHRRPRPSPGDPGPAS